MPRVKTVTLKMPIFNVTFRAKNVGFKNWFKKKKNSNEL